MYVSISSSLTFLTISRLNRIFPATPALDPDPQFPAEPTQVMITTDVAHPVDIALDVMVVTVIEALPAVVTMMMIVVVDTALPQEPVDQLMTTHLHVVDLRILTVVITHLTHTSMAELLMIVLHQEIILQEMLPTITSDHAPVTGKPQIH